MVDKLTIHGRAASATFYAAILGVEPIPVAPGIALVLRGSFELWLVDSAVSNVGARASAFVPRFVVNDLATALQATTHHGGAVVLGPVEVEGRIHATVRDPDGRDVELVTAPANPAAQPRARTSARTAR